MALPVDLVNDTDCTVAQDITNAAGTVIHNHVVTINCLPYIVQDVIFWLLVFAGIVALILIIISGFKFVTSGGDPKQAEGARKTLTYAIIGLILILLSFGILRFIADITGVQPITRFGFPECTTKSDCPGYKQYCDTKTLTCKSF